MIHYDAAPGNATAFTLIEHYEFDCEDFDGIG
jgi:hypothetical protein